MTESWTQYEGQVVDDKFPLRRYLGASDHSIVFLTHPPDNSSQDAAIKLIPINSIDPDVQLSRWRLTTQLSHAHLLSQFDMGRYQFDGRDWLYVVTEYAEENLAQILPERPLTQGEIRDALSPLLDAVSYLHSKGLVHGRIKPSNILVVDDQIKLSTDGVLQFGEFSGPLPFPSAYDAPEYASGAISPVSDSWSLGMVIVEAFTQESPATGLESKVEPDIPNSLPKSLLDIARHTLIRDPEKRWSATEIVASLNPQSRANVKTVPSSAPAPSAMKASDQVVRSARMTETPFSKLPPVLPTRKNISSRPSYFFPVAIVVTILIVILVILKSANRNGRDSSSASVAAKPVVPQQAEPIHSPPIQSSVSRPPSKSAEKGPRVHAREQSQPTAQESLENASEKNKIPAIASPSEGSSTTISSAKGDVLEQVLPEVSQKARDSIRGTVRINVRVHVNPAGNVTQSELDTEGYSKYFSELSVQAARRWTFQSPEVDGHSAPSEWVIRFEFTSSDTKAFPRRANP